MFWKTTFTDVQKYLDKIPCINQGGCGISALSMYRWLKKNNQLKNTKFIFLYDEIYKFNKNRSILQHKKRGQPLPPEHAILVHNKQFLDSSGKVDLKIYGKYKQTINNEAFIKKSIHSEGWNEAFDRKYINKIEKKLKINLEDIK